MIAVQHGRTKYEVPLGEDASVGTLRKRIAELTAIPASEQCLVARGRRMADTDTVQGLDKLMVIRRPPVVANKLTLILRCLNSGRLVRDVEVAADEPVKSVLETAKKALKLPPDEPHALFADMGNQLLRPDLSLSDYSMIWAPSGSTTLYVCPDLRSSPRTQPPLPNLPDMQASLAQALQGASPEAARLIVTLGPPEAHAKPPAGDPLSNASSNASVPSSQTPSTGSSPLTGSSPSTGSSPPTSGAAAPTRLASGVHAGLRTEKSLLHEELLQMLPPEALAALTEQRLTDSMLPAGAGGAPAALLAAYQESAAQAEAECQQRTEERLEKMCASMVKTLAPAEPRKPPATTAKAAAADRRSAKREAAAWGKGLAKGFLGARPPRKRRAEAAPSASREKLEAGAATAPVVAAIDKENVVKENVLNEPALGSAAPPPAKKPSSTCERCASCQSKLPITASVQSKCRCGVFYCAAHMHCHACVFDHRGNAQRRLAKEHPLIAPSKLHS